MSRSTTTKQSELLKSQTSALNNHKENSSENTPLIEYGTIPNSPLQWAKSEGLYYLKYGKHRLNPTPYKTKKQLNEYIKRDMWLIITAIALITATDVLEYNLRIKEAKPQKNVAKNPQSK